MQHSEPQRAALLIIDMQVGLFHGPERPWEGQRVLDNINQLIHKARLAGAPIFAARFFGPPGTPIAQGSPLTQLLPDLAIDPARDTIFDKARPSCFAGTRLADQLLEANVNQLVIAGMKTQYCIDANCRLARDAGYSAVLVADAQTCSDTPELSARQIVAHHNATLKGAFVKLQNTVEVEF
ncbi:isochorismatase family protein [Silvimonas soli]|uniref:isochorismatase family protein n=1 Tax=Silvimonas soli TaxID=2980100 RepID=UPI0024B39C84|nr:isochorismatase family protein [Silvimonas soli]